MKTMVMFRGAFLAGLVFMSGCAGMASSSGFRMASKEDMEAVERGEYNEAAMAQIVAYTNELIGVTKIPRQALKLIQKAAIGCQWDIGPQLAGAWQSAASGGVTYAPAGSGTGLAAHLAFAGAKLSEYAIYGAGAYLLPGAVNGLISGSYAFAAAKGDCVRTKWDEYKRETGKYKGIHVGIAYAGKNWGNSAPPMLEEPPEPEPKPEPRPEVRVVKCPSGDPPLIGPDGGVYCRQ